jgi:EpsI family protein
MTVSRYGLAIATLGLASGLLFPLTGHAVPPRVPMHELPFRIGQWAGRVETVDAEVVARARPDQVLARRYGDDQGRSIGLYVGYYERQAARGQVLAMCTGACQLLRRGLRHIEIAGQRVTVNEAAVRRDGIPVLVLYWYQQGATVTHDAYRGKLDQLRRSLRERRSDGAVVRISVPVITTEDEASRTGIEFAQTLYPVLRRHFPD